jgi:hypothetical protein
MAVHTGLSGVRGRGVGAACHSGKFMHTAALAAVRLAVIIYGVVISFTGSCNQEHMGCNRLRGL